MYRVVGTVGLDPACIWNLSPIEFQFDAVAQLFLGSTWTEFVPKAFSLPSVDHYCHLVASSSVASVLMNPWCE